MFLYFDLGNVVARFDHLKGCRQIAEVAGIPPEQVFAAVFDSELSRRYGLGEISSHDFHAEFCRTTGASPKADRFFHAASDIFELNHSLLPVITALEDAGFRLGILSNTCECDWQRLMNSDYGILPAAFTVFALSFQIGALKPDPKIYRAAAELAGVAPGEILFCDDILGHVTGAREAGFDAVQYTSTPALVAELHDRGLRFNY
ncbi:MAG TPA: HAD family phosphatase [Pirellulales bacterium]|jgi:FMN phosphatase YigB (HAD superfamily)|nr:HAD family phosphatase [Pirellulales bacterium]